MVGALTGLPRGERRGRAGAVLLDWTSGWQAPDALLAARKKNDIQARGTIGAVARSATLLRQHRS